MNTATTEPELKRLMVASLEGDADAHRELLTSLSGRLRGFFKMRLMRHGYGAVEAEDLVQEALMAIHTRRHTYDRDQPFTPWLYGIARYKLLDFLRRSRAATADVPIEDASAVVAHDEVGGVESTVDVEKMLATLPPKMSWAIRHVKLEGLSVNEAATRTGMSPSAIKVSVHRGLKALAHMIARERQR